MKLRGALGACVPPAGRYADIKQGGPYLTYFLVESNLLSQAIQLGSDPKPSLLVGEEAKDTPGGGGWLGVCPIYAALWEE
jgi:hypothetical protein